MKTKSSWGGKSPKPSVKAKPAWQATTEKKRKSVLKTPGLKLAGLTAAAALMLAALVATLPYSPDKTPVFVVTESIYPAPFPINGWADDDADFLQTELNGKNISVHQVVGSADGFSLEQLTTQLEDHKLAVEHCGRCIVMINALGLVDDAGQPCVVPTGADPRDPATWIELDDILARIDNSISPDVLKLVVLDCVRVQSDWDLGVFYNGFCERVDALVGQLERPNFAILMSSSPGEIAWSDSNFGTSFVEGLTGRADGQAGRRRNGKITTRELFHYVRDEVLAWSLANRGQAQTPSLVSNIPGEFQVAIPVNQSGQETEALRSLSARESVSSVSLQDIANLWNSLARIQGRASLISLAPSKINELHHELFRLEQMQRSGSSLDIACQKLHAWLEAKIGELESTSWTTLEGQWSAIGMRQPDFFATFRAHSLAWAEYVGKLPAADTIRLRRGLQAAVANPGFDASLVRELENPVPDSSERQFLEISALADVVRQWPTNSRLTQIADLRFAAESLAVPVARRSLASGGLVDLRAHRQVRQRLANAQVALRSAEDYLWAGGDQAATKIDGLIRDASEQQKTSEQRLQLFEKAYALADTLNYELPFVGRWLGDPWLLSKSAGRQFADYNQAFQELVERSGELESALSATAAGEDNYYQLEALYTSLEQQRAKFEQTRQEYTKNLIDNPNDSPQTLRELAAIANLPSIAAELRMKLLTREHQLREDLQVKSEPTDDDAQESLSFIASERSPAGADASADVELEPVLRQPQRVAQMLAWAPATAFRFVGPRTQELDVDALRSAVLPPQLIEEVVNHRVRTAMRELGRETQAVESDGLGREPVLLAARNAAAAFRRAAGFWLPPESATDLHTAQLLGLQDLLLWNTRRCLDDCWGGWLETSQAALPVPYFARVSGDYLEAIESLTLPSGIPAIDLGGVKRRRSALELLATGEVRCVAEDVSLNPGSGEHLVEANYQVQSRDASLLSGTATLFMRTPDSQRVNVSIVPGPNADPQQSSGRLLDLPLSGDSLEIDVLVKDTAGVQGDVQLVTFFRGSQIISIVPMRSAAGKSIVFEPTQSTTAQVTLFGDARQQASIVFVLDCSASMFAEVPSEAPGSLPLSKLEVAKSALTEMLDELAQAQEARVGVHFFGHRLGWSRQAPTRLLTEPDYALPIPESVSPSTDVEEVLPLGRFTPTEAGYVRRRLDTLQPWGQSPLHFAILKSLVDFDDDDSDTNQSVVVITDGVNYQFTPAAQATANTGATSLSTTLSRLKERSVPVHILGFGIDQASRTEAAAQFEAIAQQTGGSYHLADNGRDLIELLKTQLGPGRFSLLPLATDGKTVTPEQATPQYSLNDTATLNLAGPAPVPMQVEFQNALARIKLYGGEWLRFFVSPRGAIQSQPFEIFSPVAATMVTVDQGNRVGYRFRAHAPARQPDGVEFMVSLQSELEAFTDRPAEVWLEITPDSSAGAGYCFYDAHFMPGQPVPVLKWLAKDWPAEATQAKVRFWCKPTRTPATDRVTLREVKNFPDRFIEANAIAGIPGASYWLELKDVPEDTKMFELIVRERHTADSSGIGCLRVDVSSDGVQVQRIERDFDAPNRMAKHSFRFLKSDRERLLSDPKAAITFTTRSAIEADSWTTQVDYLEVAVLNRDEVFPLDATEAIDSLKFVEPVRTPVATDSP